MLKIKSKILLIITISIMSLLSFTICIKSLKKDYMLANSDEVLFASSYNYGETIRIPEHSVKVGSQNIIGTPVVIYPDNSAISAPSVKLDMAGIYTIEYRATVSGRTYKDVYEFSVGYPLYKLVGNSGTVVYGTPEVPENYQTSEGLIVKMASGSTIEFNNIIDLKNITREDTLFSFQVIPSSFGSIDCTDIIVRLSDAVDQRNYVDISFYRSDGHRNVVYVKAKASNQRAGFGSHAGFMTTDLTGGVYGFAANGSFYGDGFGTEKNELGIRYDQVTQVFYLDSNYMSGESYLADLDREPYNVPWKGFESGKIKISVWGEGFVKSSFGFLVSKMAQTDLAKTNIDTIPSYIKINYGEYTSDNYPDAVVGQPYKIFDAVSENLFPGEKIKVRVYHSYGSSVQTNVDIVDGCFIPRNAIYHTIEYKVIDCNRNERVIIVPVKVQESVENISFTLDQTPITLGNGDYLDIPVAKDFTGGNGNLKLVVTLVNKNTGKTKVVDGESYRFVEKGEYELVYRVSDYNMNYLEKKVSITIGDAVQPYFKGEPLLPDYYIKGGKYEVPVLYAEDYTLDKVGTIETKVTLKKNNETTFKTDNKWFIVPDCEYITIVFTAIDAQGHRGTLTRNIPVIDVGFDSELDMTKYFRADGGVVSSADKYLTLSATKITADFKFIRELDGKNFSMMFKVIENRDNFDMMRLTLTDYADKTKIVVIDVSNKKGSAYISVNGAQAVNTGISFAGNINYTTLSLSEQVLSYDGVSINIDSYANGEEFKGFDKFVYLTISLKNVTGFADVQVSRLNKQILCNMKTDIAAPNAVFSGKYGGEVEFNSTITIDPVYAIDVLCPYSKMTFTVISPSGNIVVAKDNTMLKDADTSKKYEIDINEYGRYVLTYSYSDQKDNEDSFVYILPCNDKQAPTITIKNNTVVGKAGESLTVPEFAVSDDLTPKDKLIVTVQLIAPDTTNTTLILTTADTNKTIQFKADFAGKYTIRILAFDENYNITYMDIICDIA